MALKASRKSVTAVLVMVLWLGLAAGVSRAQAPLNGQRLVAVRVVSESARVLEENPAALPAQSGQPFDSDAVRESLRQLYRTGRFADIRAETAEAPGGLRLDFVVRPNLFINVVRVTGLTAAPTPEQAASALRLRLGEPFRRSEITDALDRLRHAMQDDGFYRPRLEPSFTPYPETQQMDVTVRVEPGPRARIGALEIHNPTVYPVRDLVARSKLKPGQPATAGRLDRAAERVRRLLFRRGHLGARVLVRRGNYEPVSNRLPVTLDIVAGPPVRVEVTGAKISSGDVRRRVPVFQEGAMDEDLLQEGRRGLRDFLERRGYFDSDVQYAIREDVAKGSRVITYTVKLGPRRRLAGIALEGNRYFRDDILRSRLSLLPAGTVTPGLFSQRLLHADEDGIRQLYIANGFQSAKVQGEVVENYAGHSGDLFVRFKIDEGPQTLVSALAIMGNDALRTETLLSVAGSTPGQPYSEYNVASDRDNILALYLNGGYPSARFEANVEPAPEPNHVRLTYRITEGPRIDVAQVLLAGYEHTRPGIISRQIEIRPGEPLRQGDAVESQRRLYDLGIFNRVTIAPQNPDGTETRKRMVVEVEEAKRFTIAYGGGFEVQRLASSSNPTATELTASPRGILELGWANFGGRAHSLALKGRASTLGGRALLSYTAPNFLNRRDFTLQISGFTNKTRDVRTFTSTRYEGTIQLEKRFSPITSFLYRYSFRRVLVDASSLRINPLQIPLFSQPTKFSGFGFTWVRDRRDNPADPARGLFSTADFAVAAKQFGSTASAARFFFQNSTFTPLGRRLVFARSTRVGIEEPFAGSLSTDIPLPERFFAGGGTSLRGFSLNQAGPRDATTGFPIGGLAMLVFNQELRFPLHVRFADSRLGGALFYDAGNVYSRPSQITFRTSPANPADLNYLSHTIGFGIRYSTPVGPVSVDFGYQLNPARFALSTAPGGTARLPAFQVFFNFGSIF